MMDLTQIGILVGLALQIGFAGSAYGSITSRLKAVEDKISGNGTYLPRSEASLMFASALQERQQMKLDIQELRDEVERLRNGKTAD